MPLTRVMRALEEHGLGPVHGGLARCPAHDDRRPSLSLGQGRDGRALLRCHAGCRTEDVLEELGLEWRSLLPQDRPHEVPATPILRPAPQPGRSDPRPQTAGGSRRVASYTYTDAQGEELARKIRYEPKHFEWEVPDGRGGWRRARKGEGNPRVLYNLRPVLEAEAVHLSEGEKASDALATVLPAGSAATCPPAGWVSEYAEAFRGKRVTIWADRDEPGRKRACEVLRDLEGVAATVRVVEASVELEHADAFDHLEAGLALEEAREAEGFRPRLRFAPLSELFAEPEERVRWLVEERLPMGGLSLLAGKPKAGKSTLARSLGLAVARGAPWLGLEVAEGPCFYLALEEKRGEFRSHLRDLGATGEEPFSAFFGSAPEDALEELARMAERERPALLVVDTLQRLVRARDLNDYAEVTTRLEPLLGIARDSGAHVLLVHHARKGEAPFQGDAILGSTALLGSVDTALVLRRTERYRTLASIQRYGPDLEESVLELGADGWPKLAGSKGERDVSLAEERILEHLAGRESGLMEPEILEAVEGRTRHLRPALRALVAANRIARAGGGRRGDPYVYQLVPSGDSRSLVPGRPWEQRNEQPDRFGEARVR